MIELLKFVALLLGVSGLGVLAVWVQYHMEQQEIQPRKQDVQRPQFLMVWRQEGPDKSKGVYTWERINYAEES